MSSSKFKDDYNAKNKGGERKGAVSTTTFEIEIDDDEESEDRKPKRPKEDQIPSTSGAILTSPDGRTRVQIMSPTKSPEKRRVIDTDSMPIISNVKSLAPTSPIKLKILTNAPSIKFVNPAAAKYGKGLVELSMRQGLVTTMSKKASPDGKTIYTILNPSESPSNSKTARTNAAVAATSQISPVKTNLSRLNPETVQIRPTSVGTYFLLKGTQASAAAGSSAGAGSTESKNASHVNQKAAAAAEVKLRMTLAQAHIAERAQNPTRKTVAGIEYLGCRACAKTFPTGCDVMYRNHMMVKHSIEVDDATIMASKLKTDVWYKCRKCCGMIFNNKEEHHMACLPRVLFKEAFDKIEVAPNTTKPMGCGICNKSYESRTSLRQHLTGVHLGIGSKVLVDPQFRCGKCLRMFEDSIPLTIHCYTCKSTKPGDDTVLELAEGVLFCEVCNTKHNTIEETQQCYKTKGLIRCILCLHTANCRGNNFSYHMKVYHNRQQSGIPCQFCDNGELLPLLSLFEHIVEAHYNPALANAAKGIIPLRPPPPPTKLITQEKSYRRRINYTPPVIAPKPIIPPGIIINKNRVRTTSTHGGLINTSRIHVDAPSRNITASALVSNAKQNPAVSQQQQQIRFVTSLAGGLQGFPLIPVIDGRCELPHRMGLVKIVKPITLRAPESVNSFRTLVSFAPVTTQVSARPYVTTPATKPIMITSVRGGNPIVDGPRARKVKIRAAGPAVTIARKLVRIAPKPPTAATATTRGVEVLQHPTTTVSSLKAPKLFKLSNVSLQIQGEIKEKVATQDLSEPKVPVIPFVQDIAPQQEINVNIESEKKPTEQAVKGAMQDKEAARPITPTILFLTSEETLEPEDTEQTTKLNEIAAAAKSHREDLKKEEESCSSLLCEEEIPGSPTADDEDRLRFDFKDEIGDKTAEKDLPEPVGTSGTGARVRGLPVNRSSESIDKKRSSRQDESFPPVENIPLGPSFSSALGDNTPPSTPESTTLSNETGGSPHLDGGRISPTGEGGSSKSKESTDGDSGDASKTYYGGDGTRKSRKMSEPPPSPVNKRPRESRGGRNLSPPAKRRRVPRRKSPEELSRPFNYRGGRSSSSRKGQSGSDTHEVIKAPPPPPPINLGKPPKSAKFNFIPEFDESMDSDQRVAVILQAMSSLTEKYNEIKVKQQTLERRQKRRKKERERVAAEQRARQEAATAMIES